eukprot:gb/GECG01006851.1/.p1 GENE.gb/GECG01006851.1/~~gb/GECG01006851.1/.p1  ORF type:complete len:272 (+),score=51.65 gb/GECG01006851.1/:1-816(+)
MDPFDLGTGSSYTPQTNQRDNAPSDDVENWNQPHINQPSESALQGDDDIGSPGEQDDRNSSSLDMVLPVERLRRGASTAQEYLWKGLGTVESNASELARKAKEQSSTLTDQEFINHAKQDVSRAWQTASQETSTGFKHLRKHAASVLRSGQGVLGADQSSSTTSGSGTAPTDLGVATAATSVGGQGMHAPESPAVRSDSTGTEGNQHGGDWETITRNVTTSVNSAVGWFGNTLGSALGYAAEFVDTETPSTNEGGDDEDGQENRVPDDELA